MLKKMFVARVLGLGAPGLAIFLAGVAVCLMLGADPVGSLAAHGQVPKGVDDPMWQVEFRWAYGLREGELIRRVTPPYPACRAEYFRDRLRELYKQKKLDLGAESLERDYTEFFTRFAWKDRWTVDDLTMQTWPVKPNEGLRLAQLIHMATGFAHTRTEGDADLLEEKVTGDFVVRVDADPEKLAAALEKILRKECGLKVSLTVREVERKVYVLLGKYESKPLPDRKKNFIEVYGFELTESGGGGNGSLQELTENVEGFAGVPVVVGKVEGAPPRVAWHFNVRSPATAQERAQDTDPESVLKNITAQTGLTAKLEQRKIKVLTVKKVVDPAKQGGAKEAKPIEDAKAKTITLSATIEKVDAGAYVLTVRSRLFQHAGKRISDIVPDGNPNRNVRILGVPSVDSTGRDIIVSPTRMEDLSISTTAKIKAGGKEIQLADLKAGDHVNLELTVSEGGLVVVGIERVDAGGEKSGEKHLPKGESEKPNDETYYAPKVGDVRVYEVKQGDTLLSEITEIVTKVEVGGGWLRVSSDTKTDGNPQPKSSFGPMLKVPVKVGDSWTKDFGLNQERSQSYKVVKVEDVEVPAGKFNALRVETTLTTREGLSTSTIIWYAPGVGVVKAETHSGKFVRTKLLKSFVSKKHEGG